MASKAIEEAYIAQNINRYSSKLHDRSGTRLFGNYNVAGFGKETSIKLDGSYHKPEKVIVKYVNYFFYNDDNSAYVPLNFLLPGYLEIDLPELR